MDLSKLSNEDLLALKSGDLSKVSNEGLLALKGETAAPVPDAKPEGNAIVQAIKNVPGSAANFLGGIASAITSPVQTGKGMLDLGAGALRNLTPEALRSMIDAMDSPQQQQAAQRASGIASAVGEMYKDRYGGLENIMKTAIEDPVGVAADVSTVLGIGGALAPGKAGQALSVASKYTNPLSVIAPTAKAIGKVGQYGLGLTTGVGPENISQAAKAGMRGDSAFIKNLSGEVSMTDVLGQAKDALRNMRETRTGAYQQNIAATAADTKRLNFAPIDKALGDVVDSLKYNGKWKVGKDQVGKVRELENVIREWRIDPSLHTPMGLDALKQRLDALYPDSPMQAQAQRAITAVRKEVKNTIVAQSPKYAETMKAYEDALNVEKEIERALSLGNKAAQDTALRKLQSLSRNNVNTNYGNRLDLAKTLETEGGVSLMPSLSGQAMNSWTARGLGGQMENLATLGAAAFHNPVIAASLPLQSPKAVGASLYGLGRVAGGTRGLLGLSGMTAQQARMAGLLGYQMNREQPTDW